MKQIFFSLLFLSLTSCKVDAQDPLLGFEIGEPVKSWKPKLENLKQNYFVDTEKRGVTFNLKIEEKSYKSLLEINEYLTSYSDELSNTEILQISLSIDSIEARTFNNFLEKKFGFNSIDVVKALNDSIEVQRINARINPITGLPMIPASSFRTDKNLIELLKENDKSTKRLHQGTTKEIYWFYEDKKIKLYYFDYLDQFSLTIESVNLNKRIDYLSDEKIKNYVLDDYITMKIRGKDCEYYSNHSNIDIAFWFERYNSFFDKREVMKVKYDLIIKDEFYDFLEIYNDEVIDFYNIYISNSSKGIINGMGFSIETIQFRVNKKIQNCWNLKYEVKVKGIILSDGTVIK